MFVPPLHLHELERSTEIRRRRKYVPQDHHADPSFVVDSGLLHTWRETERHPRRKAGFVGDRDYPFDEPLTPANPLAPPRRTRQPAPPAPPQDDGALAYYNEEDKDDTDDFVGYVFHS
jgi:hypothetical protein